MENDVKNKVPRYEMVDEMVRLAQDLGNMKIAYIIDTHSR
ncbi:hypothetical protein YG5714_0592 [Sulfolobus islandicus Y.G.57.14]|uniref:Uncharacterized protein n=1 Tax=Saccharolobus islandicus (strain Y.G.57.14 / Yellowstone \|nr:hypothetical protein YG5714_0592 [Sulfolobus islandicus Y.G.57.14]